MFKKCIALSLALICTLSLTAEAQQKVRLYLKITGEIDAGDEVTIYGTQPPADTKNKRVPSIDSLIDYQEINNVIKSQEYKGVRVLNELALIGWSVASMIPIPENKAAGVPRPRLLFLLSKEYVLPLDRQNR